MITAEEARKKVTTKYEQEVISEIDEIDRKILAAVDKGDTSMQLRKTFLSVEKDVNKESRYEELS